MPKDLLVEPLLNYVKWQNRTKINGEMGHLPLYKDIVLLK